MSTRGSVAWREPDGFVSGVYISNCSQPTAAGKEVFAQARASGVAKFIGDLKAKRMSQEPFDPFDDALAMEWVYMLRPEAGVIEVWAHALCTRLRSLKPMPWSGKTYTARWSGNFYTHAHVADIVVVDPEPDWNALEARVKAMALTC